MEDPTITNEIPDHPITPNSKAVMALNTSKDHNNNSDVIDESSFEALLAQAKQYKQELEVLQDSIRSFSKILQDRSFNCDSSNIPSEDLSLLADESDSDIIKELKSSLKGFVYFSVEKSRNNGEGGEIAFLKNAFEQAVHIITSNVPPCKYEEKTKTLEKMLRDRIVPIKQFDEFPNAEGKIKPVWNQYLNGKLHGKVTKVVKNDSGKIIKYEGNAIQGKFEGQVRSYIDNGDVQVSTMSNDQFDGFSLYTFKDGSITYDSWRNGKKDGKEILLKADESLMYWKDWKDGVKGCSKLYKPK